MSHKLSFYVAICCGTLVYKLLSIYQPQCLTTYVAICSSTLVYEGLSIEGIEYISCENKIFLAGLSTVSDCDLSSSVIMNDEENSDRLSTTSRSIMSESESYLAQPQSSVLALLQI